MAGFVFAYSGGEGVSADEAERAAQYARWERWFEDLGAGVLEAGAATGAGRTIGSGRSVTEGGSLGLPGYSIVAADSLDAAVELAKGCPVDEVGGAVDVYEMLAM